MSCLRLHHPTSKTQSHSRDNRRCDTCQGLRELDIWALRREGGGEQEAETLEGPGSGNRGGRVRDS